MSKLREAAIAVYERWESPLWKDLPATARYMHDLRNALDEPEQKPVACIYNGNQYMCHEFMDDKIPEGSTPLYAAPVDTTRLETEYTAATLRINNDLMVIAALTAERDALMAELQNIANANTRDWDDPTDFKAWAQSRARAALAGVTP